MLFNHKEHREAQSLNFRKESIIYNLSSIIRDMKTKIFLFIFSITTLSAFSQTIDEGIKAWENDKFGQASAIFRKLVATNNPEAYYYMGSIYLENAQDDSAKFIFDKGIAANNANAWCYVGMGKYLLNAKDFANAKKNFDKALSITKEKDIKVLNAIGDAYLTADNTDAKKAQEVLTKSLAVDNKRPETFVKLGDAYLVEGQGGPAISNYEKALEINIKWAKPYLRIGQVYSRSRNFQASLENLNKAIELEPNYAPAHRDLGELYYKKRDYDKAKASYQKYIELSDKNVATLTRYASFLFLSKDYEGAITNINEVLKMDSSNVIMKRLLGYSYFEKQKYPEGLSYMTKFFAQANPSKILASDYEYLGKLQFKSNKDSLAAFNLQQAITKDTSKTELYGDLGDVYTHWKKYPQAQWAYNKKISTSKKPAALDYFGLGKAAFYAKNYNAADSAFAKVVEIKPDVTIGYFWRARTATKLDATQTYETCKPYADKYIDLAYPNGVLDPKIQKKELIEMFQYEVSHFANKNDMAKTKEYLNKILEIDPENKEAKDNLSKIK